MVSPEFIMPIYAKKRKIKCLVLIVMPVLIINKVKKKKNFDKFKWLTPNLGKKNF